MQPQNPAGPGLPAAPGALPRLELSEEESQLIDTLARRQHIEQLRIEARQHAGRAAVLLLVGCAGMIVMSVSLMVPLLISGGSLGVAVSGIMLLIALVALVYSLKAALGISSQFTASSYRSAELLREHPVLPMLLDEHYWQQIGLAIEERLPLKLRGRSSYRSFADHLRYCACHLQSLVDLSQGAGRLHTSRIWLGQCVYLLQPLFELGTVYVTAALLLTLLLIIALPFMYAVPLLPVLAGLLVAVVYLSTAMVIFAGRDYIVSRGALSAFCAALLDEA